MKARVVIAGGGLAAQRCAETLRRGGHDGEIVVLAGEQHRPYDRPPLSKQALLGPVAESELAYREESWYAENRVRLGVGVRASALDAQAREVFVADGCSIGYDELVVATGSRARRLPQFEARRNVHTLRDVEDASRLRQALTPGARLLIVGAGFIGQEVASAAERSGVHVTIVEIEPAPLARIIGAELGGWFAELHRRHGVEVITADQVEQVHGASEVNAVTLAGGRTIQTDLVLVGAGSVANCEWLAGSGLGPGPVRVDESGRSAVDGIWAAGDAASRYDARLERFFPGTQWESAARQGAAVARSILGQAPRTDPPASFWSDIHGVRVHHIGRADGNFDVRIEGDTDRADFKATFECEGDVLAVLLVGRPQELPAARALVGQTTKGATRVTHG